MTHTLTWTYVVTATNVINDSIEVDTTLNPFYVSVDQFMGTEENDFMDEQPISSIESDAADIATEKAYQNWGNAWYNLQITWISENGNGDQERGNLKHWTRTKKTS